MITTQLHRLTSFGGNGRTGCDLTERGGNRKVFMAMGLGAGLVLLAIFRAHRQAANSKKAEDAAVDEALDESFPASDPPSYAGQR